jgi:hypothetical protein
MHSTEGPATAASELDGESHLLPLANLTPLRTLIRDIRSSGDPHRPIHISTAIRWCTRGARAPDGSKVHLRAVKRPGCWLSRPEWIREFFDRLTVGTQGPSSAQPAGVLPSTTRTPAERRWAVAQAQVELQQLGMGA